MYAYVRLGYRHVVVLTNMLSTVETATCTSIKGRKGGRMEEHSPADLDGVVLRQEEVAWLEVAMCNVVVVEIPHTACQLRSEPVGRDEAKVERGWGV